MKPEEAKKIIDETGIKFYKVAAAAACSIHPTILSGYVNNKKSLTNEQMNKLETFLNRVRNIVHR